MIDTPWIDMKAGEAGKIREWLKTANYQRAVNQESKSSAMKVRHWRNIFLLWLAFQWIPIKRFGFWHAVQFLPVVDISYAASVYDDGFVRDDCTHMDEFDAMDYAREDMSYWD